MSAHTYRVGTGCDCASDMAEYMKQVINLMESGDDLASQGNRGTGSACIPQSRRRVLSACRDNDSASSAVCDSLQATRKGVASRSATSSQCAIRLHCAAPANPGMYEQVAYKNMVSRRRSAIRALDQA